MPEDALLNIPIITKNAMLEVSNELETVQEHSRQRSGTLQAEMDFAQENTRSLAAQAARMTLMAKEAKARIRAAEERGDVSPEELSEYQRIKQEKDRVLQEYRLHEYSAAEQEQRFTEQAESHMKVDYEATEKLKELQARLTAAEQTAKELQAKKTWFSGQGAAEEAKRLKL